MNPLGVLGLLASRYDVRGDRAPHRERSVVDVDCRLSPGEFDPVWHSQTSSAVKAVESDAPRLS